MKIIVLRSMMCILVFCVILCFVAMGGTFTR